MLNLVQDGLSSFRMIGSINSFTWLWFVCLELWPMSFALSQPPHRHDEVWSLLWPYSLVRFAMHLKFCYDCTIFGLGPSDSGRFLTRKRLLSFSGNFPYFPSLRFSPTQASSAPFLGPRGQTSSRLLARVCHRHVSFVSHVLGSATSSQILL